MKIKMKRALPFSASMLKFGIKVSDISLKEENPGECVIAALLKRWQTVDENGKRKPGFGYISRTKLLATIKQFAPDWNPQDGLSSDILLKVCQDFKVSINGYDQTTRNFVHWVPDGGSKKLLSLAYYLFLDHMYLIDDEATVRHLTQCAKKKPSLTASLTAAIKAKIRSNNVNDMRKFQRNGNITVDDVKELLTKCKLRCYVCNDMVLTSKWKSQCWYQFSLDRIDNLLPHDKTNVLISCYYCNCIQHMMHIENIDENNYDKVCIGGCHTTPHVILETRQSVIASNPEKINQLRLS